MPFLASAFREKFVSHSLLPCAASILPPCPWYLSDIPSGWDVEQGAKGCGWSPQMLVSLTAPKLCSREFKGRHLGWADGLCRQKWHAGSSSSYRSSPALIASCCCMMRYEEVQSHMNCILLLSLQQTAEFFSKLSSTLFLSERPAHYNTEVIGKENCRESSSSFPFRYIESSLFFINDSGFNAICVWIMRSLLTNRHR